jgi:hypothetical protein
MEITDIISAYQILVMSEIPEYSVVKKIEFGWINASEQNYFETPVWRIELSSGKTTYYNAQTGEIIL